MSNRRPVAHILAPIEPPEGSNARTNFKRIGVLWEGEKPGSFSGFIEALPSEWLGGGFEWRIVVSPIEARDGDNRDDNRNDNRRGSGRGQRR